MKIFKKKSKSQDNNLKNSPNSVCENGAGFACPQHIGIIMDGNGRWASRRGLPRSAGHRAGAETLRKLTEYCSDIGVKAITAYAFSTENWNRPPAEVDALMKLLYEYLKDSERRFAGKNCKIRVIGDRSRLSTEIIREIERTEELTRNNTGLMLNFAINYGGRDEIARAARLLADDVLGGKFKSENITPETIGERLYTSELPELELIIRTGGERRLSNFLLWQAAYAELWYCDTYFPDFKKSDMQQAIADFQSRDRRYGKV